MAIAYLKRRATHAGDLERWLGRETVEQLSASMRTWYGPPIAVAGVPGAVFAYGGGDFRGHARTGRFASALDMGEGVARRLARRWRRASRPSSVQLNAGFASLSALIEAASTGKRRDFLFQKLGTGVSAIGACHSYWPVGNQPVAGAIGSAAPGGRAPDDTTTGAFLFSNPTTGETQHFVGASLASALPAYSALLYDRIFDVAKTASSSATEAVTGVPTRYQSSTPTAMDFAGGNFLFIEIITALAATAHNWTVCLYRDDAGNDAQTLPLVTGLAATGLAGRLDMPLQQWFCPLAAGDRGIMDLAQMQCSSAAITGTLDFVIGHPIAFMPCPVANLVCIVDGINSAFNLVRIFDDACLAFLDLNRPTTAAPTISGQFTTVDAPA
jgi:hypothetical protein